MKKQIITREFLEKTGITKITEDGRIFKGERELAQRKIVSKHKYGVDKVYLGVMLYDPECYQYQKAEHAKDSNKYKIPNGQKLILVHRIVYAWFNGSTPADLDIAHKDDNSFNNSIDNLEAISHGENIAKRSIQANQYRNKITELTREFDDLKSQAEALKNTIKDRQQIIDQFKICLRLLEDKLEDKLCLSTKDRQQIIDQFKICCLGFLNKYYDQEKEIKNA